MVRNLKTRFDFGHLNQKYIICDAYGYYLDLIIVFQNSHFLIAPRSNTCPTGALSVCWNVFSHMPTI